MEKATNTDKPNFLDFFNGNYIQSVKEDELSNNDSKSYTSESLISDNFRTESTINDYQYCDISLFVLDELGFKRVHAIAGANENDNFFWEDVETESNDTDSTLVAVESTEGSIYLVESTFDQELMTPCILFD